MSSTSLDLNWLSTPESMDTMLSSATSPFERRTGLTAIKAVVGSGSPYGQSDGPRRGHRIQKGSPDTDPFRSPFASVANEMWRHNGTVLHMDRKRANSFGAEAERYDRARPTYPQALVDELVARHPTRVLDVGCGTGIAARLL